MKNLYVTDNPAEAQMLKEFLENEGIEISLHQEALNPTGYNTTYLRLVHPGEEVKAKEIIREVLGDQTGPSQTRNKPYQDASKTSFFMGALAGIILCLLGVYVHGELNEKNEDGPASWDNNGDGVQDAWAEYADGRLILIKQDNNFDGKPDQWSYYREDVISRSDYDTNFDGQIDQEEYFKNGMLYKGKRDTDHNGKIDDWIEYDQGMATNYKSDNDGDGRVDEWGSFENNMIKERFWSYGNDATADKKAVYKNGRKTMEAYDRNRDGRFDEMVVLDQFERVVETKNNSDPLPQK